MGWLESLIKNKRMMGVTLSKEICDGNRKIFNKFYFNIRFLINLSLLILNILLL